MSKIALCSVLVPGLLLAADPAWGWESDRNWMLQASAKTASPALSYPSFNSELLDRQLALYLRYLALFGPPDILIVGSSRAVQGVDPVALQVALASVGYPGLKIFNFGINGGTARVVELQLRQLLTPEQLPRMIVWADGLRAFNSGRSDRTYSAIVASPGYQRLSAGIRPTLNPTATSEAPAPPERVQPPELRTVPRPVQPPPAAPAAAPAAAPPARVAPPPRQELPPPGNRPPIDPINFLPGVPSPNQLSATALATYKTAKQGEKAPCNTSRGGKPITPAQLWREILCINQSQKVTPQQQPARSRPVAPAVKTSDREISGFIAVETRYNPATYYQRFRRVPGQYDGDYTPFRLQGEQAAALRSVAAFARERKIPLVVVNLPLTGDYLDATRSDREREFQEFMQQNARSQGFLFRDLSRRWLTEHDYFADPSHLNRFGAEAVSRQLAQDRTIPWPVAK